LLLFIIIIILMFIPGTDPDG